MEINTRRVQFVIKKGRKARVSKNEYWHWFALQICLFKTLDGQYTMSKEAMKKTLFYVFPVTSGSSASMWGVLFRISLVYVVKRQTILQRSTLSKILLAFISRVSNSSWEIELKMWFICINYVYFINSHLYVTVFLFSSTFFTFLIFFLLVSYDILGDIGTYFMYTGCNPAF